MNMIGSGIMKAKKNLDYDDQFKIEKGSSAGIIVLILMMALVGGLGYYYFAVVDSAKNLFMHIYDKMDVYYFKKEDETSFKVFCVKNRLGYS